ncbi:hypothetical protein AC1031_010990 [Aphanomyces cochlioides]|nr:hypothetical protein AC1031_010990 [Aphanomyces cochlioides]
MAHTAQRQLRCAVNRKEKAAVYLETLLRNVNSKDLTQSSFGIQINQTIFMPLMLLDNGPEWVHALQTLVPLSSENEVALWQQAELTHYSIHFQNRTTCISVGCTLVRNSTKSLEALGGNWDTVYTGGSSTVGGDLMRASVAPSALLTRVVGVFQSHFYRSMDSICALLPLYESMEKVDAVPPSWSGPGIVYFGGNPACVFLSSASSYPQTQFNFDGTCQERTQFSIHFDPSSVLFSVFMTDITLDKVTQTCSSSIQLAEVCS